MTTTEAIMSASGRYELQQVQAAPRIESGAAVRIAPQSRFYSVCSSLGQIGRYVKSFFYTETSINRPIDQELCRLAEKRTSPFSWSKKVTAKYGIDRNKDQSSLTIVLELPIACYEHYCALQKRIARLIPIEEHRPTIDLRLIGERARPDSPSTYAIIGGIGPLSDAEIVKKIITHLPSRLQNSVKISLLSSPPPRSLWQKMINGFNYTSHLVSFLNGDHYEMCLASNTAHLNYDTIHRFGRDNSIHLVSKISDRIQNNGFRKVLVLGTTPAFQQQLYPRFLEQRAVECVMPSIEQQEIVQDVIDQTKQGHLAQGERIKK